MARSQYHSFLSLFTHMLIPTYPYFCLSFFFPFLIHPCTFTCQPSFSFSISFSLFIRVLMPSNLHLFVRSSTHSSPYVADYIQAIQLVIHASADRDKRKGLKNPDKYIHQQNTNTFHLAPVNINQETVTQILYNKNFICLMHVNIFHITTNNYFWKQRRNIQSLSKVIRVKLNTTDTLI